MMFELTWIVGIFIAVLTVAIHVIFAVGVYMTLKGWFILTEKSLL